MGKITVCIPYKQGRQLAKAYNEAMDNAATEWVLLLDWDLFNCSPYWYDCCVSAIEQAGPKVGWITCVTNSIGSNSQKAKFFMDEDDPPPACDNMRMHMAYARRLHRKYNEVDPEGGLVKVDVRRFKGALSGFFILTNKTAWKAAGGFNENRKRLMGVDNHYSRDICRAGYRLMGMPGLYFYHMYRKKARLWRGHPH